jgi:hypothetical protein
VFKKYYNSNFLEQRSVQRGWIFFVVKNNSPHFGRFSIEQAIFFKFSSKGMDSQLDEEFQSATQYIKEAKHLKLNDQQKLNFYKYFKQGI